MCVFTEEREKEERNEKGKKGKTGKGNSPYLISSRLTENEIPFPGPGIKNAVAGQGI